MAIRYWLFVHPLDRARELIANGVVQHAWGGVEPLNLMRESDGMVLYCPRTENPDGDPLRVLAQAGRVLTAEPYRVGGRGRTLWRHDVQWLPESQLAPIRQLRDLLELTRNSMFWGEQLRPGWVELSQRDFMICEDAVRRSAPAPSPFGVHAASTQPSSSTDEPAAWMDSPRDRPPSPGW
nr:hypothetical protein [Pseudoclavibacter sp. Marseille-Q3772]